MTALDFLQWPAMAVTVFSGWLVASQNKQRRNWGFWLFLMSNVLWVALGLARSCLRADGSPVGARDHQPSGCDQK